MGRRYRTSLNEETHFFVTTTVVEFTRVFGQHELCDLLVHNIKHYQEKYKFEVLGYVIMPSHFHWIVELEPSNGTISDIMRDIKKYSAWDIMEWIEKTGNESLRDLFYDNAKPFPGQKRKFWMHRFDDEVIRNTEMLKVKLEYIHNNPLKAGLVGEQSDYKYSSARNYYLGDHSVLYVKTDWY
ncbi:MAG: transposase [Ignavibacteriae bacterium]|nr:transposase [Ignavibacteriota bacterium]